MMFLLMAFKEYAAQRLLRHDQEQSCHLQVGEQGMAAWRWGL